MNKFIGNISQVPPVYSAVKIKGKAAYRYARRGEKVEPKPREVVVKEIELTGYEWPVLKLRIVTGPGVYIRSIARDLGEALQVGGYLANLKRTRVGDFTIANTIPYNEITEWWKKSQEQKLK